MSISPASRSHDWMSRCVSLLLKPLVLAASVAHWTAEHVRALFFGSQALSPVTAKRLEKRRRKSLWKKDA